MKTYLFISHHPSICTVLSFANALEAEGELSEQVNVLCFGENTVSYMSNDEREEVIAEAYEDDGAGFDADDDSGAVYFYLREIEIDLSPGRSVDLANHAYNVGWEAAKTTMLVSIQEAVGKAWDISHE